MSYVAVMHLHPVAFRRDERGRVVVLAFLMLVLVSSVALVGNSDRDGDGDAAVISASANVVQSEASLLSRLQNYPGILARAGSFQRLSTAEQPAQLPVANTGWGSVDAQAGAAQAAAFEQQQMMQEQVHIPTAPSVLAAPLGASVVCCRNAAASLHVSQNDSTTH